MSDEPYFATGDWDELDRRSVGCLAGAAVGDALGGPTEGHSVHEIRTRYGGPVTGVVAPFYADWATRRPTSPYYKGDGHVTDDTLMTRCLVSTYADRLDHLDAFDVAATLVPKLMEGLVWVPELERETVPLQRIFLAEKWLVARLHYGHVDPREAGTGNMVNCGAAMYMAPVGIANAGDPGRAYAEAIDIAGAHQSSYGREAAGVFAAAVACAMDVRATVSAVVATCTELARDGTRDAIVAVCETASGLSDPVEQADVLRAAVSPFDSVGPDYRQPHLDARRPSRTKSIEELPVALGLVVVAGGDYRRAVLGGVNYGRDSDSIATMAGAIAGALSGASCIPSPWLAAVASGSRLDLAESGLTMARVARAIHAQDVQRAAERATARSLLFT
jgi:ADP-ribosylglycohydrolase